MRGDCLHLLTHMHKQSTMHHTIALVSIIIVYGLYAYAAFCQKFNLCDRSLAKDTPSELKISKLHYNYPTCYLYYNFRSSAGFYAKIENYTAERRKIFLFLLFLFAFLHFYCCCLPNVYRLVLQLCPLAIARLAWASTAPLKRARPLRTPRRGVVKRNVAATMTFDGSLLLRWG